MKKMMFLMLTILIWGAASMNAQVRIGGSGDPVNAAVLDLNPNNNATNPAASVGGLSLPRVALGSVTQTLYGQTPTAGTIVYNTSGLQGAGLYVWTNQWTKVVNEPVSAGQIATVKNDSAKLLRSNGNTVEFWPIGETRLDSMNVNVGTVSVPSDYTQWKKIFDGTVNITVERHSYSNYKFTGAQEGDICTFKNPTNGQLILRVGIERLVVFNYSLISTGRKALDIICYRPV